MSTQFHDHQGQAKVACSDYTYVFRSLSATSQNRSVPEYIDEKKHLLVMHLLLAELREEALAFNRHGQIEVRSNGSVAVRCANGVTLEFLVGPGVNS